MLRRGNFRGLGVCGVLVVALVLLSTGAMAAIGASRGIHPSAPHAVVSSHNGGASGIAGTARPPSILGGRTSATVGTSAAAMWSPTSLPYAPSGLFYPTMTFDAADGYVLLFGGCNGVLCSNPLNETWKFSDGNWTQLHPLVSPPGREEAAMTFDVADGYVVLYGGRGASGDLTDTWTFSGGTWTAVSTSANPGTRVDSSFAYDIADHYAVIFGSYACFVNCGTWRYVGGNWSALNVSAAPPDRYGGSMAYDPIVGELVLFGGVSDSGSYLSDTWTFTTGSWAQHVGLGPALRVDSQMAWAAGLGALVLFGGTYVTLSNFPGVTYGDTWEFTSAGWSNVTKSPSPPAESDAALSADGTSGSVVLLGGCGFAACPDSQTWVFGAASSLTVSTSPPTVCNSVLIAGHDLGNGGTQTLPNEDYQFVPEPCAHYEFSDATGTGGVTGAANQTWMNLSASGILEVTFSVLSYEIAIAISPASCGTIAIGNETVQSGASLSLPFATYNLSASGCAGETFTGWAVTGGDVLVNSTDDPTTVTPGSNGSITADFAPSGGLASAQGPLGLPLTAWIGIVVAIAAIVVVVAVLRRRRAREPVPGPAGAEESTELPAEDPQP